MHPYEWGILGVKALDFYPIFDCADCTNIAPAVVAAFVAAPASIATTFPSHLGSDRIARSVVNQPLRSDV